MSESKRRVKVGSDGFVELLDWMGTDATICDSARVSYEQAKSQSDNRTLIRYLMRHRHTTPFEMAELKFRIRVPMDVWRQGARHRMTSTNEYSQRYREAINAVDIPEPDQWRLQSTINKQGSEGVVDPSIGKGLSQSVGYHTEDARRIYEGLLEAGVAREQARRHLPLCTYTQLDWKIDLHNFLHFLQLRMAPDAQQEIREFANAMHDLVSPLFPYTFEAFEAYRLRSITLTLFDIAAIQVQDWEGSQFENKRERSEYLAKLQRLMLGPYAK